MDIYCTRCGEPWDNDSIHDRVDELRADQELVNGKVPSYKVVKDDFVRRGCVALGGRCNDEPDRKRAELSAALFDILGDDVDGVMVEMEDAEFFGFLDDE